MPPMIQAHPQDDVAVFKQRTISRHVRGGPGMGLHVRIFDIEELFGPVTGKCLHRIHMLTAAIIAFLGVSFRVFVGKDATIDLKDGIRHEIFARNQFEVTFLTFLF